VVAVGGTGVFVARVALAPEVALVPGVVVVAAVVVVVGDVEIAIDVFAPVEVVPARASRVRTARAVEVRTVRVSSRAVWVRSALAPPPSSSPGFIK
jgi:hypothetical protein